MRALLAVLTPLRLVTKTILAVGRMIGVGAVAAMAVAILIRSTISAPQPAQPVFVGGNTEQAGRCG